ncbi:hypothetical protein OTK49_00965 [Vibrio coralliirubri]|uniref:hypothetical protein n=1 Tax=Vibrio coralliirubri TaxID=1516159 RepID=UPI0022840FF3|nr:hypothetical protein [Vibrio coralliirubri]MCY9861101.1 hypothetical protein [Vibrio coralliirubri]
MKKQAELASIIEKMRTYNLSSVDIATAKIWIVRECVAHGLDSLETDVVIDILLPKSASRLSLMVFGHKRHGKDTACEYLNENYGVTFASSSYTACELFLFEKLKGEFGYQDIEEAFADRENHRQRWYEEIKAYNEENGLDALGKVIFESSSIYCGIRDRDEFNALKAGGYFDLAVWIDAGDRLPPEEAESMKLTKEDADIIITNNGDLVEFYKKLDSVYEHMLKPQ